MLKGFRVKWLFMGLFLFLSSLSAQGAQSYSNQGVTLPFVGWMGLDSSLAPLQPHKPFGFSDQALLGLGYLLAINDTLWIQTEAALGMGSDTAGATFSPILATSTSFSLGFRYNFSQDSIRPFLALGGEFFKFLQDTDAERTSYRAQQGLVSASAAFIGLRPAMGIEWIFYSDMGLELQSGYLALWDVSDYALRHSFFARTSYNLYF